MKGRCMKCKKEMTMGSVAYEVNAIGKPVCRGKCDKCGTKMYRMLGADNTPADLKTKVEAWKKAHAGEKRTSKKSKKSHKSGGKSRKSIKSRKSKK